MSFLEHFVNGDERLEGLYLVCLDRLPKVFSICLSISTSVGAYTFMPDQKDVEDLWSHV